MGRKPIEIDKDRVIELYKKYGTLIDVVIRTDYSKARIREILVQNGVEVNKRPKSNWNRAPFRTATH